MEQNVRKIKNKIVYFPCAKNLIYKIRFDFGFIFEKFWSRKALSYDKYEYR